MAVTAPARAVFESTFFPVRIVLHRVLILLPRLRHHAKDATRGRFVGLLLVQLLERGVALRAARPVGGASRVGLRLDRVPEVAGLGLPVGHVLRGLHELHELPGCPPLVARALVLYPAPRPANPRSAPHATL